MTDNDNMDQYLTRASVSPEVFALRPDYRALLMVINGIAPGPSDELSERMLQDAEKVSRDELAARPVTEIPHVKNWRDTIKAFGGKPNKTRNSLEALTRRVESG
jgi:DNA/RNA-binding domain of Phe-tRNA-synthetase-like protein